MKPDDLAGLRFGRLTVTSRAAATSRSRWNCRCDCGAEAVVFGTNLKQGITRSCGCLSREHARLIGKACATHGDSYRQEGTLYGTWGAMKSRCLDPNAHGYEHYGARGISIYEPWVFSYVAFRDWVLESLGARPSGYMLDRIDNDGDYRPGNLRWATRSQQNRNRRRSRPRVCQLTQGLSL